ncbi:hypothetical protein PanWU01x14_182220 [Parasponia andersonii]|uniref:Transmembrane protein n=1 Tax=Parasponia andersonii TaxID=3476 RepID=A0A2P5C546_PARAD|nr:hypothetical protein PanWU01x14_182220 [Parasponia andersonii]
MILSHLFLFLFPDILTLLKLGISLVVSAVFCFLKAFLPPNPNLEFLNSSQTDPPEPHQVSSCSTSQTLSHLQTKTPSRHLCHPWQIHTLLPLLPPLFNRLYLLFFSAYFSLSSSGPESLSPISPPP